MGRKDERSTPDIQRPTDIVILSEAKLQRSPERFRGEAGLSISDHPMNEPEPGKPRRFAPQDSS
jgi:hypothetical protein